MGSSQSLFQNASNFEVKDTQFNTTITSNGDVTIVNTTNNLNDPISTILWPHVASGAIFDSAARYAAGKCHPGTREKIIERIVDWTNNSDPTKRILWLYGAAGAGKSAIAHTICELLKQSHPDNYGGSFFFEFGPMDRGNAFKLFATLSYQLAIQFPGIRTELNKVLSDDPSLPTKSMEIQFYSLIVRPLLDCRSLMSHSPTFIIDGLDECADDDGMDVQRNIVALIAQSIVDHDLPIRFMIASRPEYWIRDAFDTAPSPGITFPLSLRDDVDADKDIKAYLTEEFGKIRVENKRIMGTVVLPWPPAWVIRRLLEEASGQYIYAATILKFVGKFSKFSNPQRQLEIIMSPGPYRATAFSDLDRLYATILSAFPQWETMKRVLAGILVEANLTILKVILRVDPNELVLVLDALSSLIDINKARTPSEEEKVLESVLGFFLDGKDTISFCHRSFREFLQDQSRSGTFYIDLYSDAVPSDIVQGFFDMVCRNIDQNYEIEPPLFLGMDLATYHDQMKTATFLSARHCSIATLLRLVNSMTSKLALWEPSKLTHMHSIFHLIREMEHLDNALLEFYYNPSQILERAQDKEKPEILADFQAACKKFNKALSPLRDAFSALPSCIDFKADPTLVYLTEYQLLAADMLYIDELPTIAGVADYLSTLRQYRYLVPIINTRSVELKHLHRYVSLKGDERPHWRTQGAWRDLRISFAQKSLKFVLQGHSSLSIDVSNQYYVLRRIFDSRSISDISTKEYFQNTCNIALLAVIADPAAWTCLLPRAPGLDYTDRSPLRFIVSILCWINRQLTNPQTVTLLEEYDKTLRQTMLTTMEYVFQHYLITGISYKTGLRSFLSRLVPLREDGIQTCYNMLISIKVRSLPHGLDEENIGPHLASKWPEPHYYLPFHDEVFGKSGGSTKASTSEPIIDPLDWHPHLLARLLNDLVKFLYGLIHPEFLGGYDFEEYIPYITQCMPYARPTPENLDALRAIVYLYPRRTCPWNPPEGFWTSIVELLHKYDRSLLSSEELDLFVRWLDSTEHADIETYVL